LTISPVFAFQRGNRIHQQATHKSRDRIITYAVGLVWFAYVVYSLSRHSMFRDELNAWQIAKNATSIIDIFSIARYDGRPPTYYLLLRALAQLYKSPEGIKLISILCAGCSAFVVLRKFRMPLYLRMLFLFSFPFSGTYFVFVREYSLIVTLLALLGWIISEDKIGSLLGSLTIGVLMLVNLFGLLMGVSLALYMVLETRPKTRSIFLNRKLLLLVPLAGLSAALMVSPSDSFNTGSQLGETRSEILRRFVYKFVETIFPLNLQNGYENLTITKLTVLLFIAGAIMISAIGFFFWGTSKAIFATFVLYSSLFFGNVAFGYAWYWWHFGMYQAFVVLLAVVCIGRYGFISFLKPSLISSGLLTLVFLLICVMGTFLSPAKVMFSSQEFSNAKNAANAILGECQEEECFISSSDQAIGVPLAGYLNKPIYFLDKGHIGSFFDWRKQIQDDDPITELESISKGSSSVLLASSVPLSEDTRLEFIAEYSGAVWENYWIYRLVK
jgi:hypothetical protein